MAKNNNLTDFLTDLADGIRTKKGTTGTINPQNFRSEIASITTAKPEQTKTVTITENGTITIIPDSGKVLTAVTVTTNVQGAKPTLNAPAIALSGSTITITDNLNGNFVTGYKVFSGSTLLTTITGNTIDLKTVIEEYGTYTITVKAVGTNFNDSAASNSVEYEYAASGGHNLTIQYNREDAPSGIYMYSYGKVSYRVNGETAYTEINSAGTTQIENCNTVELYSAIGPAEWEGSGVSVTEGTSTIKFNGQDYTDNTLVTLTQDSTFIITETPTYAEMDNPCDPKCCFVAGTKVKTPNGEQPIETLKAGDYITTYNEEAKQYEPNKVLRKLINRNVTELATLKLSNGETLQFNAYHPLLTENGYKSLTCHNDLPLLTKEDKLIGGITIEEIVVENLENPIAAYNLLVENNNNFIVNGVIALGKDD